MDALETAFKWVCGLRKDYSANSDIWRLRARWNQIKYDLLTRLNDGSYQFDHLERYEFDDGIISLWSSQDMIALKLIAKVLVEQMEGHIPKTCYHISGHGGLKKAVCHTHEALSEYAYVMRSDVKGYYQSIRFDSLMGIIESYTQHPILLTLLYKALRRTETRGGNFYDYHEKSLPRGSPLSPLLGAVALIPLDKAMGKIRSIYYARFMDDWIVLAKNRKNLRRVVRTTHQIINGLQLKLHPDKTYIGKISNGFNFLGYYFDDLKILPSKEVIRRASERATALYEPSPGNGKISSRHKGNPYGRDISQYQTNEPAPTEKDVKSLFANLLALIAQKPGTLVALRKYLGKWACWLKSGLSTLTELEQCVQALLPSIFSCWVPGTKVFTLSQCQ